MSDFLTNLAMRTLQPAAVVQPRLPTRFEPWMGMERSGEPASLEEVVERVAPPVPRREIQPEAPPPGPAPQREMASAQARQQPPELPQARPMAPQTVPPSPAQSPARPPAQLPADRRPETLIERVLRVIEREQPVYNVPLVVPAQREMTMARSHAEPAVTPPRGKSATPLDRPPGIQPSVESTRVVERRESTERLEVERRVEHREMTRVVERQMPAPPAAIQPRISAGAAEVQARGEPEPTIVVTIGRIDIRAQAPAEVPQAARARTASPAVPLEEYLRRRSQGDRG